MARVRSISNHPYNGVMRPKGSEYDAAAGDVELLVALRRVIPVPPVDDPRAYATRELHASPPTAGGKTRRRRAVAATPPASTDPETRSADGS